MTFIPQTGFRHALLASLYIAGISFILFNGEKWFSGEESFILPMMMLMLLVLSVAVMGALIFGKPLMLYIDGKKKEGVQLAGWTIGWLCILTVLVVFLRSIV